jgi:hypothetical protein
MDGNWKADTCQQLCLSRKLTASVVSHAILTVPRFLIADIMVQASTWNTGGYAVDKIKSWTFLSNE